jgi:hypothetical protein
MPRVYRTNETRIQMDENTQPQATNETVIGGGGVTPAVGGTDANMLAVMDGENAIAMRADVADGQYVPAEAKLYSNFLKIGYGTGEGLKSGIPVGAFFFAKTTEPVVKAKVPMKCVIIKARGFWREWKKWDPNSPARDFASEALALAAGLRTKNPPYGSGLPLSNCSPALELHLLIEKPANSDSPEFNICLDGKQYALARTIVEKAQYREIERMMDNIPRCDATFRGVPSIQGRIDAFPVTLTTTAEMKTVVNKTTGADEQKAIIHLALNFCFTDKGERIRTTDQFHKDFAEFKGAVAAAMAAPVATDESVM